MKRMKIAAVSLFLTLAIPYNALAATLEGTLSSLGTAVVGRIFPLIALVYLGINIMGHIQGDPNAKRQSFQVGVGIVLLLGINGVWQFIAGNVK